MNSQPVLFFAQRRPSSPRQFVGPHGHGHRHGCSKGGCHAGRIHNRGPFNTVKKMAFAILSLFAFSIAIRFVLFLLAVVFSPPVLLLCLFAMVVSLRQDGEYARYFSTGNRFDTTGADVQRTFRSNRCFYNFFNMQQQMRGPGTVDSSQCYRRPTCNSASSECDDVARGVSQQQRQQQELEFEAVNGAVEPDTTTTDNNTKPNGLQSQRLAALRRNPGSTTQYQNVPVHREETDEALTLALDISGFDIADIQVLVKDSELIIRGERQNALGDKFVLEELTVMDTERFLEDTVTAQAYDGILKVRIQKNPALAPRVISITTANENPLEKKDK